MPSALTDKSGSDRDKKMLKKRGSVASHDSGPQKQGSMSSLSFMDEYSHEDQAKSMVRFENTYQLGPYKKFPAAIASQILQDVMEGYLGEEKYDAELCKQMARTIADVAKARVKELLVARYKIVCLVHVGQLRDQGLVIGSRCLWDSSNDTFASYQLRNGSLFAVGSIYALYYE